MSSHTSLRRIIQDATGQNLHLCRGCLVCNEKTVEGMDIPLGSLVQLVLMNDEDVLTSRTLWSESALELARTACIKILNLERVLLALREEAIQRGVKPIFKK